MAADLSGPPALAEAVTQSVTPSYRRNGKLFSCEPCRRGKLRCDHNSPVCGRCARRNKPEQCIYHPAPLTKPRVLDGTGAQRTSTSASPQSLHINPYPVIVDGRRTGLASPPSSSSTLEPKHSSHRGDHSSSLGRFSVAHSPPRAPMAPSPPLKIVPAASIPSDGPTRTSDYLSPGSSTSFRGSKTGFLGPTSYSSVYTEVSHILEMPAAEIAPDDVSTLSPDKIQQGAEVLSMLRDIPVYRRFTQRWFEICDGVIILQHIIKIWLEDIWNEFGHILAEGKPEQLRNFSELVWRNTQRPLKVHGDMSATEWASTASGRNLRWEVVGVILSLVGIIAVNLSHWDTIFDSIRERYVDRATFADQMRKASEFCLCFCYESEVLNDIYVCFMFEDLILVQSLKGDAHYAVWQRTGELCDAIVAMGFHQGNRPDAETPFFLAELRKKIFISAYGHDKVVATFLGRPPRLSHRYCKMECPLDLSDDQLFSQGPELDKALSTLDADGWSTNGTLNRNSWLRVWFQHCRIREDILEIALGTSEEDITAQAEQVRQRMNQMITSMPAFMRISPEEMIDGVNQSIAYPYTKGDKAMRDVNAVFVLCIHTGILHTEFLLQRALISRLRTDTKQLIPISTKMLKLVLLAVSRRDFFRDFQGDLVYLLTLHGLPAAGVLAVEMLKQEQTHQYTPDILNRSETVQDLSVFISALAAVGPGEGSFSICDQGRRALKKVLDRILSPHPPPKVAATGESTVYVDSSLYFPIANDADFLQWLDNVEWDNSNWIDQPIACRTESPGARTSNMSIR